MSLLPFPPSVRSAPTHGSTQPDSAAPGSLLPARGGTLTPEAALALVRRPGDAADSLLAPACRIVEATHAHGDRAYRDARMLLESIPARNGGEKP